MRKALFIFFSVLFISLSSTFAQSLMDYVSEVKGDVLVLKDYYDMGSVPNSLNNAILADTIDVPAGRVYELKTAGWYPQSSGFTTPSNRPTVIEGTYNGDLVTIDEPSSVPPLISGFTAEGSSSTGGITWGNDLTIKNTNTIIGAPDGTGGWAFFGSGAADAKVVFQNNMMEYNWWVFIQSNGHAGTKLFFKDNYFVNMSGRACRRNGGVYDNTEQVTDTVYIENNTHVMGQGYLYKFRNFQIPFIYVNHNTFVNISSVVFETQGYQSNNIITNNVFINCQAQPFRPNMVEDLPEQNALGLEQGLIDIVHPLPDSVLQEDRKFLVENNLVYWDPKIADLASEANSLAINGFTNWVNQTMTMNAHTQALFDDDANFPYLTETGWINKLPTFTDPADLLTDQVDIFKEFSINTVDSLSTNVMPTWRLVNLGPDNHIYTDFPIPVDLSYSDADLMVAGTDGLPLGDLNWFPTQKADFLANHAQYYGDIVAAWNAGTPVTDVQEIGGIPTDFELSQNYPNPFNPTTAINFSLAKAGNVTLKVYNSLGQEVTTLVDGFKNAQNYKVTFDASKLSSGVYYYSLSSGNFVQTKKMMLLK